MTNIVINIQNGLLAEAITSMLYDSGEFQPYRVDIGNKKNGLVDNCEMLSADIVVAEVSYTNATSVEARLREAKELRRRLPSCKIVLLCDENSAPNIARDVALIKKDGYIDNFFYSSVTAKYLLAALSAL